MGKLGNSGETKKHELFLLSQIRLFLYLVSHQIFVIKMIILILIIMMITGLRLCPKPSLILDYTKICTHAHPAPSTAFASIVIIIIFGTMFN